MYSSRTSGRPLPPNQLKNAEEENHKTTKSTKIHEKRRIEHGFTRIYTDKKEEVVLTKFG